MAVTAGYGETYVALLLDFYFRIDFSRFFQRPRHIFFVRA
jgi:hypothetical protein